MTPINSAARADRKQIWGTALRISEVKETSADTSEASNRVAFAKMTRVASAYLHAGWKWLERKRTLQLSSRRLRLSETISLGEKRSVSIVQVDGAQFLIGCSTGSVQLLAVLDKTDANVNGPLGIERAS